MSGVAPDTSREEVQRILESARRLGVELDENETLQWLAAMAAGPAGEDEDVVVDVESGVFGHRVTMLDFTPRDLARFREIGRLIAIPDRAGVVETALALSGSAAQSKIQTHPGDCDYFQRVNIKAATREEACRILAEAMRDKALQTMTGPGYRLAEVKFGSYPRDVVRDGQTKRKGAPISWSPAEVQAGSVEISLDDGAPSVLAWDEVASDPGWCKLDWVVTDPARGQLASASNMLDVTWEAPDGAIVPLDGYLDAYFQEVYLDAGSIPVFAKLARHVSADALEDYVDQLEKEVRKYLSGGDLNYGKAAKRMYNVFRLTGRHLDAAFVRELFDEPAAVLYQVWSLIHTLDSATQPGSTMDLATVIGQADELIVSAVRVVEDEQEAEIVRALLRLRDALTRQQAGEPREAELDAARASVINIVNNFFGERLKSIPTIKSYIEAFQESAVPG